MKCAACQSDNPADSRYCRRCGSAIEENSTGTLSYSPAEKTAVQETLKFNPGERFGDRYTIIEEIGRGGMGRVYKAEDRELGITVVLKMIRPELASRPRMIDQLRKETLLGRSVSHENVVRIHDLGVVDTIKYISMDFIKGENLAELIQKSGNLTLSRCLQISLQICQALKAAHEKGIIHQDLKPQNIMVDSSSKVYVMDFGLAESLSIAKAGLSRPIRGTPRYISPEQAKGEEPDRRSDIYSLGAVLYEMMTGQAPFKAETSEDYFRQHISAKPFPPSKANPLLPPACEKIVLKCLEKKKEDRYQTVDELIKDLEIQKEHVRGLAAGTKIKRWRTAVVTAATTVLIGFGAYHLFVRRPRPPSGRTPVAVMFAVNNSGDKSLDEYLRWQIPHYLYMDLAQSKYLSVWPQDRLMQALSDMRQLDEEYHLSKTLDRIADIANVEYFVLPSFTKVGDNFWISFTVRKAKTDQSLGEPDTVKGRGLEDLFSMVEVMSLKVKSRLDLSPKEISDDYNPDLGQITTTSPEALRYYIEGNKFHVQGDFEASVRALEKAVAEDPNFAMAYLKMAIDYDYLGDYANHKAYLQKALTLQDHVSERDRYLIQGYATRALNESPLKAIEIYQKLIALDPQDEESRTGLGVTRRNLEEWDLALEQFDQLLALNPKNSIALENKVFIYTAKGWYEKALELCASSPKSSPNRAFFVRQVPLLYLIQGRNDLASAELKKARADLPDDVDIIALEGNLHHLMGDLPAARRIYEQLRRSGEAILNAPDLRGRDWLTQLLLLEGRYGQAQKTILEGIALAQRSNRVYEEIGQRLLLAYSDLQTRQFSRAAEALKPVLEISQRDSRTPAQKTVLHLSGLASLGMGQIEEAKGIGRQLRQLIEGSSFTKQMRRFEHLMGQITLAEGLTDQAVRHFERAISLLPEQWEYADEQAFYYDGLAAAFYQDGDLAKAAETYRAIISLTTGRLQWGDIYARSYYWLGKIQEKTGNNVEAAAQYSRFLQLWNNADSGLPEVTDAQKRLEALRKAH